MLVFSKQYPVNEQYRPGMTKIEARMEDLSQLFFGLAYLSVLIKTG
jgi:hypothetical protein